MKFEEKLMKLRKEKGLSQEELGNEGKSKNNKTLIKILIIIGVIALIIFLAKVFVGCVIFKQVQNIFDESNAAKNMVFNTAEDIFDMFDETKEMIDKERNEINEVTQQQTQMDLQMNQIIDIQQDMLEHFKNM